MNIFFINTFHPFNNYDYLQDETLEEYKRSVN